MSEAAIQDLTELELSERPLEEARELASRCRACPLWKPATQTVFGEGNPNADLMLVGEQPGDKEDLAGRPFQGPAGRLLDKALKEAGLEREQLWVTNAVKHFKWKSTEGKKRRLHEKPSRGEMKACRPWLMGEIARVEPRVLVTLGSTAAQSVIRSDFKILSERGETTGENEVGFGGLILATVHPSLLLRIRDDKDKEEAFGQFVSELARAREMSEAREEP